MHRWLMGVVWLALMLSSPSWAAEATEANLAPKHRKAVQRWAATLPAAWRSLDWPALIDELTVPHPDVGGPNPYLDAWLPSLFKWARIPGPNDPPVIVLTPSCQCSSGVLEIALVWQDGRLERFPMQNGVAGVEFRDGALHLRADRELSGDANCCPSIIEQRSLRWVDNAPVWRTQLLPGELSARTGCWNAARLVDAENAYWVDTSALGISRKLLQQRLFACSRDPEQEKRRVSKVGKGLRIALDDLTVLIDWNVTAQRWEVREEARRPKLPAVVL